MQELHVPDHASFTAVLGRAAQRTPEAFADGVLRNLYGGGWHEMGDPAPLVSPVDGTSVTSLAKVDAPTAQQAVHAAAEAHIDWSTIPLAERQARVTAAVAALADARDDLAVAGLGDRQTVAAGVRGRRPRVGRGALVSAGDPPDARHGRRRQAV